MVLSRLLRAGEGKMLKRLRTIAAHINQLEDDVVALSDDELRAKTDEFKRRYGEGETLDGEGGYTVYGKLMPAKDSLALGGLPLGLAHRVKLTRPIASGQPVKWTDVAIDADSTAVKLRREMEATFRG